MGRYLCCATLGLFQLARVDPDLGTIVWPTGVDIEPGVLYDWPEHVDAIVQRRRRRFGAAMPVRLSMMLSSKCKSHAKTDAWVQASVFSWPVCWEDYSVKVRNITRR